LKLLKKFQSYSALVLVFFIAKIWPLEMWSNSDQEFIFY